MVQKVNIDPINRDHFNVFEKTVGDEIVYLIVPKPRVEWSKDNLIFRSSVWTKDGQLISGSYKKFFNWEEKPDIDPIPNTIEKCQLMEKIDGSTLIISKYKYNLIIRTRGSIDTSSLDNHHEIDIFKTKYPKVFDFNCYCGENFSYIYEWVSPENRIILNYTEPKLILTGVVHNVDYTFLSQHIVDTIATQLGVERPKRYEFNTLNEMSSTVKDLKGVEGLCVYYNNGQSIRKVKTAEYLMHHKARFNLSHEKVLDLYLEYGCPLYDNFVKKIVEAFDYEMFDFFKSYVVDISNAAIVVKLKVKIMGEFVNSIKMLSRKDAAEMIIKQYGKDSCFVFNLYDNKPLSNSMLKKLFLQFLNCC